MSALLSLHLSYPNLQMFLLSTLPIILHGSIMKNCEQSLQITTRMQQQAASTPTWLNVLIMGFAFCREFEFTMQFAWLKHSH